MNDQWQQIRQLRQQRPRERMLQLSLAVLGIAVCIVWWQLDVSWDQLLAKRRVENLQRFLADIYPFSLREEPFSLAAMTDWVGKIWNDRGAEATFATLAISVTAIVLAALSALVAVLPASSNITTAEPFLPMAQKPPGWVRRGWTTLLVSTRLLLIVTRAIPEYIWAFLLLAMMGPSAWPAILALALHNFGILGKLGAEVVENIDPHVPRALRAQGLTRVQIGVAAIFPMSLTKWLLFFFYRWETCVREATVLGILGIASLGFHVRETRARDWYDEMLLFILFGALLVMTGDIVSSICRRWVRRS